MSLARSTEFQIFLKIGCILLLKVSDYEEALFITCQENANLAGTLCSPESTKGSLTKEYLSVDALSKLCCPLSKRSV